MVVLWECELVFSDYSFPSWSHWGQNIFHHLWILDLAIWFSWPRGSWNIRCELKCKMCSCCGACFLCFCHCHEKNMSWLAYWSRRADWTKPEDQNQAQSKLVNLQYCSLMQSSWLISKIKSLRISTYFYMLLSLSVICYTAMADWYLWSLFLQSSSGLDTLVALMLNIKIYSIFNNSHYLKKGGKDTGKVVVFLLQDAQNKQQFIHPTTIYWAPTGRHHTRCWGNICFKAICI